MFIYLKHFFILINGGERERLDVHFVTNTHVLFFFIILNFKKIQKFERAHIFTGESPNFFFPTSSSYEHFIYKFFRNRSAKSVNDCAFLWWWKNAWDVQCVLVNWIQNAIPSDFNVFDMICDFYFLQNINQNAMQNLAWTHNHLYFISE